MFEINKLEDVRGNNVVIYSIKTLIENKCFPKLSIFSGVMGVGKSSVARVVAKMLDESDMGVKTYNLSDSINMEKLREEVFTNAPISKRCFIFEEIHGMSHADQNALLQMFDTQPNNTHIICTTTELHSVLRTIRSRANLWEFKLLSEKQLAQLLDDYLDSKGYKMSDASKQSLLKSCKGVPRDLIKNADFAISGNFNSAQLDSLLGNVSDETLFITFCALKSNTADFVANLDSFIEESTQNKLRSMNDFWLRYIMERTGNARRTLPKVMVDNLDALYNTEEINRIAKMLLRATPDTLLLELVSLNLTMTSATAASIVGQQKDIARSAEQAKRMERQQGQRTPESAQLTTKALSELKL